MALKANVSQTKEGVAYVIGMYLAKFYEDGKLKSALSDTKFQKITDDFTEKLTEFVLKVKNG